ncbi:MAG: glycosyltransferase family 9 protein [Phycisphaerales bacterium]|nr:MAG: glycosyltransferase family 9 protein [Phycisphaerales bacterium]
MNILVLHNGALGDCALALHLIAAMKQAWDEPLVTLAARSPLAQWARKHGLVADAGSLDQLGGHRLYGPDADLPEDVLQFLRGFDRVVSLLGGPTEAVSVRLSTALGDCLFAIDPRPTEATLREGVHITRQWAGQLADYGCPVCLEQPARIKLTEPERASYSQGLARRLGISPGPIMLCHPGSGGLDKCCPIEVLEQHLNTMFSKGWSVVWIIGPDELERFGHSYMERLRASAPVVFEESVEAAADLICGARAYIGNDAGMTHVAALSGVRTLAIFGPTDPHVWRPLGNACEVIRLPVSQASFEVAMHGWVANRSPLTLAGA